MRAIARAQNELEVTLDSLSYPGTLCPLLSVFLLLHTSLTSSPARAGDFMPRLEGLGYRLEDNMHLLSLDSQGQPQAPPKPGSAPTGPVVVPNLPAQKISARVNDPETQRKVGKPSKKPLNTAQCTSIIDALKEVYKLKVKPVEEAFKFGSFFSPVLNDADFDGKPQVLLLGQYSTGKTTFIKHLIGRDYPGCHIGPDIHDKGFADTFFEYTAEKIIHETQVDHCICIGKPHHGIVGHGMQLGDQAFDRPLIIFSFELGPY